jgi:hypothetical protein
LKDVLKHTAVNKKNFFNKKKLNEAAKAAGGHLKICCKSPPAHCFFFPYQSQKRSSPICVVIPHLKKKCALIPDKKKKPVHGVKVIEGCRERDVVGEGAGGGREDRLYIHMLCIYNK